MLFLTMSSCYVQNYISKFQYLIYVGFKYNLALQEHINTAEAIKTVSATNLTSEKIIW